MSDKAAAAVVTTGQSSLVGIVDYGAVMSWFLLSKMDASSDPKRGEESEEKKALRAEIKTKRDALDKERNDALTDVIGNIGYAAWNFSASGETVVGTFGLYMKKSAADMLDTGLDYALKEETVWGKKQREIYELEDKLWKVEK